MKTFHVKPCVSPSPSFPPRHSTHIQKYTARRFLDSILCLTNPQLHLLSSPWSTGRGYIYHSHRPSAPARSTPLAWCSWSACLILLCEQSSSHRQLRVGAAGAVSGTTAAAAVAELDRRYLEGARRLNKYDCGCGLLPLLKTRAPCMLTTHCVTTTYNNCSGMKSGGQGLLSLLLPFTSHYILTTLK